MDQKFDRLVTLLKELFQLDQPDLDCGLYRHIEDQARTTGGVCGLRLYADEDNARALRTYEKSGMVKTPYELFEFELRP